MLSQKQIGLVIESEHKNTYQWFLDTLWDENKNAPTEEEFFLHIVNDHLKEDPNYYQKLRKAGL